MPWADEFDPFGVQDFGQKLAPKKLGSRLTVCFVVLLAAVLGCDRSTAESGPATKKQESSAIHVTTVKPQRKTIARSVRQPGQIEAFLQAPLYAKMPGYVRRFLVDIGDTVQGPCYDTSGNLTKRGQLLAEVAIPELDQELRQKRALVAQAKAEVEQARAGVKVARAALKPAEEQYEQALANLDRAEADYAKWESEYQRMVKLAETKAINSKLVDEERDALRKSDAGRRDAASRRNAAIAAIAQIQAEIEKAEADEVAAQARQAVAEADEARVTAMAEYQRIEAPFDGVVSQRIADVGHFVQPAAAAQARPLFTVVQTDVVRIFVDVPETDAPSVDVGDQAVLQVPALEQKEFPVRVTRTAWALDSDTRTLRTEVDVPNEGRELRPGMYAFATIVLAERANALVVPTSAVRTEHHKSSCFCLEEGKLVQKSIGLGLKSGKEVEVISGLTVDDVVVEKATAELKEGQPAEAAAAPK
ncbi:MAG TPA: efflux RND transporter periplasmic adaptor subunit [Pirellulales bacterium]|nr:efflux RND transporter periplasmic adaptor subunit [Pirellulales bacterium]